MVKKLKYFPYILLSLLGCDSIKQNSSKANTQFRYCKPYDPNALGLCYPGDFGNCPPGFDIALRTKELGENDRCGGNICEKEDDIPETRDRCYPDQEDGSCPDGYVVVTDARALASGDVCLEEVIVVDL